jgi:hypothetical protein
MPHRQKEFARRVDDGVSSKFQAQVVQQAVEAPPDCAALGRTPA